MDERFTPQSRQAWRRWLETNHDSTTEIRGVFYKRHTGKPTLTYNDAVEEGVCFGWINAAKRPETRQRRLAETMALLERGRKLGMR